MEQTLEIKLGWHCGSTVAIGMQAPNLFVSQFLYLPEIVTVLPYRGVRVKEYSVSDWCCLCSDPFFALPRSPLITEGLPPPGCIPQAPVSTDFWLVDN